MAKHDLVFRGCAVYDGTKSPPVVADVAIVGDRITGVGKVPERGGVEVSARGLALAPGFIDVHAHDDFAALLQPELPFKLLQGVTTTVVGNCGMGAAPYGPARELARSFDPRSELPSWHGYQGYLERLEEAAPSANVAVLAGHGSIRAEVMGVDCQRASSADELRRMQLLLDEALEAGVVGVSTGLIYEPGRHAERCELVTLARQLGRGGLYASHIRNEADGLLEAVAEALAIAEAAEVSLQLSHHKASGRSNWGRVVESLSLVDAARARGKDVWVDVYPYTAGSTLLSAIVENGFLSNGAANELRPADVVLATVDGQPELEGYGIDALAERWRMSAELAVRRLLELDPHSWVVVHSMSEKDVRLVLQHPAAMIGSDGIPQARGRPHPRLHGTFPRVLGHYARTEALLPLETAVHKMTGLPAQRFGISRRGRIAPDWFADLVLFDPASVLDAATFDEPRRTPVGVHAVYVNGRAVVRDGIHLGTRPGRVLRRAA